MENNDFNFKNTPLADMDPKLLIIAVGVILIVSLVLWCICGGGPTKVLESSNIPTLDLHGVHAASVEDKIKLFLSKYNDSKKVQIITGIGNHSEDGKPVVKPIAIKYLNRQGYIFGISKDGGSIYVYR